MSTGTAKNSASQKAGAIHPEHGSFGWYRFFMATVTSLVALAVAAMFGSMLTQGQTLGEHSEKLNNIAQGKVELLQRIDKLEAALVKENEKVRADLEQVQASLEAQELDLPKIIAKMGIVEPKDVMASFVLNDMIYAVPNSAAGVAKLKAAGMKREVLRESLSAFRMMPVSVAVKD